MIKAIFDLLVMHDYTPALFHYFHWYEDDRIVVVLLTLNTIGFILITLIVIWIVFKAINKYLPVV